MKLTPEKIRHQLPKMHHSHRGLSDAQAEIEFLKVNELLIVYIRCIVHFYKNKIRCLTILSSGGEIIKS